MAGAAGVVWLDVKAAQALLLPATALLLHAAHVLLAFHVAQQHDSTKVLEPVGAKVLEGELVHHGVRVALLNLAVQLSAQVVEQRQRHLVWR